MDDELFKLKALALLHDPPYKAWWLWGQVRIYSKDSHEEEAKKLYRTLTSRTGLEIIDDEKLSKLWEIVEQADKLAASFDRWALAPEYRAGYIVKPRYLYNIFNVNKRTALQHDLSDAEVNKFIGDLVKVLQNISDPKEVYFALYASLELLWIIDELPTSPADTRIPTHTIFDHLYATAMATNLLLNGNGSIDGYLVKIDVPGIQRFISSARKAGDYRVGSLMVSWLVWLTIQQLIEKWGPDILISPTARMNPYFYLYLEKYSWGQDLLNKYIRLIMEFSELPLKEHGIGGFKYDELYRLYRLSIIPGTAFLILPKEENPETITECFKNAYKCIINLATCGSCDIEPFKTIASKERRSEECDDCAFKLISRVYSEFKDLFDDLRLPLRLDWINIGKLKEALVETAIEGPPNLIRRLKDKELIDSIMSREEYEALKALETLLIKLVEKFGKDIVDRLLFHFAMVLVNLRKSTFIGRAWFDKDGRAKGNYWKYNYWSSSIGPWTYSTLDRDQPSIIKFPKIFDQRQLDYSNDFKEKVKSEFGIETRLDDLKRIFKPGEALGPLDIVKRGFYLRLGNLRLGIGISSVEEAAIGWHRVYLSSAIDKICSRKVIDYFQNANPDIEVDIGEIRFAEKELMECGKRIIKSSLAQQVKGHMERDLGFFSQQLVIPTLMYTVIRADADNIGKYIHRGFVAESLTKVFNEVLKDAEVKGDINQFKRGVEHSLNLVRMVEDVFYRRGVVLLSPAYETALSMALMLTAITDVLKIEYKFYGIPVFSGGDDLLAFTSIITAFRAVKELRVHYWGINGFHKLKNYEIPALAAYGKSFSIRFSHSVTDVMSDEVAEATKILDEAKDGVEGKDAFAISISTGYRAFTKVEYVDEVLKLWEMLLNEKLSRNLPYDLESWRDAIDEAGDLKGDIVRHVVERNIKVSGPERQNILKETLDIMDRLLNVKYANGTKPSIQLIGLLEVLRSVP